MAAIFLTCCHANMLGKQSTHPFGILSSIQHAHLKEGGSETFVAMIITLLTNTYDSHHFRLWHLASSNRRITPNVVGCNDDKSEKRVGLFHNMMKHSVVDLVQTQALFRDRSIYFLILLPITNGMQDNMISKQHIKSIFHPKLHPSHMCSHF